MMKKFLGKYKGKSIFKNMFMSVFGLAVACTFLACIAFFIWFSVSETENEKQNDISMLYSFSLMVDNYILSIQDTMEVLQNDTYVKKVLTMEASSWNDDMMVAAQEIINTVTVDAMYHSIYVIKDGDYILKCTNPSYPLNMQADKMMIETFYQSTFGDYAAQYYIDIYKKNQSLLYMTNGEQNPGTGEKVKGIIISVDIGKIMESILPPCESGEQYFLTGKDGNIVYAKGNRYKNGEMIQNPEVLQVLGGGEERVSQVLEVDGERYLFSYVGVEESFYLVHMIPYKYITAPINHVRNIFITISVLFVFFILLLAFGMSNWVYYPIDAVVNTTKSKAERISDDVEERLKNTELSSIYQTYHSMVQTLNNLTMKKEQQELAGFLSSKSHAGQLPEWVEETYGKEGILSRVVCLRISDTQDLHDNNTQEAIEFEFQTIINIIGQVLKPLGNVLVNPIDKEHIAVILFSENTIAEETLVAGIQEIFKVTQDLVHISMDAGISNEKSGYEELASMYKIARAATSYRFLYGMNAIITENAMVQKAWGGKAEIDIDRFVQCLKDGNREGFWEEYDSITLQLMKYSLQAARDILLNMAAEMLKFKNSLNYNYAPLGSLDYEALNAELGSYEYMNDVRKWFDNMADEVWNILTRVRQSGREDVVDKAVIYLNENYADTNISAQYIADMFHITPSYFSRLFNERTGCAFPDYLATLRTEKAKEMLLEEDNRSIQEISEAVGYVNSSYFTATFKKKCGITPGQFRKNHRKSEEF